MTTSNTWRGNSSLLLSCQTWQMPVTHVKLFQTPEYSWHFCLSLQSKIFILMWGLVKNKLNIEYSSNIFIHFSGLPFAVWRNILSSLGTLVRERRWAPLMHSSSPKSESRVVALIRATHFGYLFLGLSLNLSIFHLWLNDDLGNLEGGKSADNNNETIKRLSSVLIRLCHFLGWFVPQSMAAEISTHAQRGCLFAVSLELQVAWVTQYLFRRRTFQCFPLASFVSVFPIARSSQAVISPAQFVP